MTMKALVATVAAAPQLKTRAKGAGAGASMKQKRTRAQYLRRGAHAPPSQTLLVAILLTFMIQVLLSLMLDGDRTIKVDHTEVILLSPPKDMLNDQPHLKRRIYKRVVSLEPMKSTRVNIKRKWPQLVEHRSYPTSKYYEDNKRSTYRKKGCVLMRPWQSAQYPICNIMHEVSMVNKPSRDIKFPIPISFINKGSQTAVFELHTGPSKGRLVLKMAKWGRRDFTEIAFEERRVDAIVAERLTSSPYITPVYGFCGTTTLAPYADQNLEDIIESSREGDIAISPLDRLRIGAQVASGLEALHSIDRNDGAQPSFAHNDLGIDQYLYRNRTFQLNDFASGRFILRNPQQNNKTCPGHSDMNDLRFRAPEDLEYIRSEKGLFQMDKADVFSMCNILYTILTDEWIWDGMNRKIAGDRIIKGEHPPLPERMKRDEADEAEKMMVHALSMCWVHDPNRRATATEVAGYLRHGLRSLESAAQERRNENSTLTI